MFFLLFLNWLTSSFHLSLLTSCVCLCVCWTWQVIDQNNLEHVTTFKRNKLHSNQSIDRPQKPTNCAERMWKKKQNTITTTATITGTSIAAKHFDHPKNKIHGINRTYWPVHSEVKTKFFPRCIYFRPRAVSKYHFPHCRIRLCSPHSKWAHTANGKCMTYDLKIHIFGAIVWAKCAFILQTQTMEQNEKEPRKCIGAKFNNAIIRYPQQNWVIALISFLFCSLNSCWL